jgi:spore maturation protein SpmA
VTPVRAGAGVRRQRSIRSIESPFVNGIFFAIVAIAFAVAAVRQLIEGTTSDPSPMQGLASVVIDSASGAVELAIGLVGVMTLFLGLMKVAEKGGLLLIIARLVQPLMRRLFPDVPVDHPAMGAMILNISANVLGLGNAATPFGIRAMQALDSLNPNKGTATNAMVVFLAINTSSVTLLPTGVIALRAAAGSADPAGILPTTLFATILSTAAGITAALALGRFWPVRPATAPGDENINAYDAEGADGNAAVAAVARPAPEATDQDAEPPPIGTPYPSWVSITALLAIVAFVPLSVIYGRTIAPWIIPTLVVGLLGFGVARRVPVYEAFIDGARDGFQVALRIIPYLVAILVAVGMFRQSGALELLVAPLATLTEPLGLPAEALPMALLRPLSGSGAYGLLASIINDPAIGPDSYTGYLVSTLQGSTETTFYVLAVYFGAIGIKRIRHALAAGLIADAAGIIGAVIACSIVLAQ